jgi:hypothetical protein
MRSDGDNRRRKPSNELKNDNFAKASWRMRSSRGEEVSICTDVAIIIKAVGTMVMDTTHRVKAAIMEVEEVAGLRMVGEEGGEDRDSSKNQRFKLSNQSNRIVRQIRVTDHIIISAHLALIKSCLFNLCKILNNVVDDVNSSKPYDYWPPI